MLYVFFIALIGVSKIQLQFSSLSSPHSVKQYSIFSYLEMMVITH